MQDSNIDLSILSAEGLAYANCFERWFESIPNLPATQVAIDESQRPERLIHVHVVIGHTRTLVCAVENESIDWHTLYFMGRKKYYRLDR